MKYLYSFFVFSLLWGCSGRSDNRFETVTVNFSQDALGHFLDMVSEITLLPLETSDSILLGSNNQLSIIDNEYYVSNTTNKKVFRFAHNGRFLNTIGVIGRGPGEFTDINNYLISNDTVIIYSSPDVLSYSRSGDFIPSIRYPGIPGEQLNKNGDELLVYGGFGFYDRKRLYSYNLNSDKFGILLNSDANVISITESSPVFYNHKEEVFVREMYCDTVYRYNTAERVLAPYLFFDKGKYKIDRKCFTFDNPYESGDYFLSKVRALTSRYMENDEFRFVEFFINKPGGGEFRYGINRKNEPGWIWFKGGDSVLGFFSNSFRLFYDNRLYCIFEPFQLKNIPDAARSKISHPEIADNISENDNPVIGIISFKSN